MGKSLAKTHCAKHGVEVTNQTVKKGKMTSMINAMFLWQRKKLEGDKYYEVVRSFKNTQSESRLVLLK